LGQHESLEVSAAGNAIVKALVFIELLKRETEFELHQTSSVKSIQVEEKLDKKIEGLEDTKKQRTVTLMNFSLSKAEPKEKGLGYQEPVTKEEKEAHKKSREDFEKDKKERKAKKGEQRPARKGKKGDKKGGAGGRKPRRFNDDLSDDEKPNKNNPQRTH